MGKNPPSNLRAAKTKNTIFHYFIVDLKAINLLANLLSTEKKQKKNEGRRRTGPIAKCPDRIAVSDIFLEFFPSGSCRVE